MNTTKVKILAMAVIHESDLPKQEKLELLDFVVEVEDLGVMKSVLESYALLDENCKEDEENVEECSKPVEEDEDLEETFMGPLKTPRDEDISEMTIPSVLEALGPGFKAWEKSQIERPRPEEIPRETPGERPGAIRLSKTLKRIRPFNQAPRPTPALP